MTVDIEFPLYERAHAMGVLDGGNALIVAPTATGKSHIGRQAIINALARGDDGTHAYLVPFRALASEVYDSFFDILSDTDARLRIATGDYRDPIRPDDADLVVATYESFAGLVRRAEFRPGVIVADEVHLLADDDRGPVVEGLFARLLASGRARAVCALSAVVENGAELADWLGIPLLEGTEADRPVPLSLGSRVAADTNEALKKVLEPCRHGEQALVFCSSRAGAEKAARLLAEALDGCLSEADRKYLSSVADAIQDEGPAAAAVGTLMPSGVAYHHAGLTKLARRSIERAYREGRIRIITATPTLAAGVNLPAGIAVVRDIFRSDVIRGIYRQVLLPSGEILNMLGRAARPHQVKSGSGVVLLEKRFEKEPQVRELLSAVTTGRGGTVVSRLPDSFEAIMRFVLAVVVESGEATREDVASAFSKTLAYHSSPEPYDFDRPFEEDLMEDIPAYQKVVDAGGAIRLKSFSLSAAGVQASVQSGAKEYEVTIGVTGVSCTCPAASQFYKGRICKHEACAIHDLLFGQAVEDEARMRTIYNCGHIFGPTLDLGTRLNLALQILTSWHLIERVPGGWRATPVGDVAAASGFDLLLVHEIIGRLGGGGAAEYSEIAKWAVEDYFENAKDRARWAEAIGPWLAEMDVREIGLPTRYRGDFERGLEDLARVCTLYEKAAAALAMAEVAEEARKAASALRYGVDPVLVPLMGLGFPQLARARSRYLYERGIRDVQDLAGADPAQIADARRAPEAFTRDWVERAKEIHQARAVAVADRDLAGEEFDELVARFQLDPAVLS